MRLNRLLLLTALFAAALLAPVRQAFAHELCFGDKSPHCMKDPFSDYWETNGGLPVFGYPVTAAANEPNADTGKTYLTQWVERNRMEDHPENAGTPYRVLLGRLGAERLQQLGRDYAKEPYEPAQKPGCLYFPETGHNVCDQSQGVGFKTYWENHGLALPGVSKFGRSLQLFGLPLTEPKMETNANGDTVLTQWFERARFEWHPNNPNEFKVLLGLLGKEVLAGRAGMVSTVKLFLMASGGNIGCGEQLVSLPQQITPTNAPLTAAMKALLELPARPIDDVAYYNALAQSDLEVGSVAIDAQGVARINFTGQLRLSGVCDAPRISEQLKATALQFPTVSAARFFVNDVPLETLLSSQ
ncbi:MAG TPA: GerMN domain-containing protein [Herpetosiphonaceae bacterium]